MGGLSGAFNGFTPVVFIFEFDFYNCTVYNCVCADGLSLFLFRDGLVEPTDWSHWLNWEFLCSVFVLPVRISAAFLLSMRSTYTSLTVKVRSFFWFIDLASFYGLSSLTVSCASYFFSDFDVFPPPCSRRGTL